MLAAAATGEPYHGRAGDATLTEECGRSSSRWRGWIIRTASTGPQPGIAERLDEHRYYNSVHAKAVTIRDDIMIRSVIRIGCVASAFIATTAFAQVNLAPSDQALYDGMKIKPMTAEQTAQSLAVGAWVLLRRSLPSVGEDWIERTLRLFRLFAVWNQVAASKDDPI